MPLHSASSSPSFGSPSIEPHDGSADARPRRHLHAVPAPRSPRAVVPLRAVPDIPPPDLNVVRRLAVYSYEVLDGTRAVAQLGGWITREVAEQLSTRRAARTERRTLYRDNRRSVPTPGPVHLSRPAPLVTEVTIVLRTEVRSTAVAMRLEFVRDRWRATELTVL